MDIKVLKEKAERYDRMKEINKKSFLRRQIRIELYIAKARAAGIAPPTEDEVERELVKRLGK